MNTRTLITVSIVLLAGSSCTRGPEYPTLSCDKTLHAQVVSTEAPATGKISEMVNIPVSFQCINGCGQFGRFEEEQVDATTTDLKVMADYKGCTCTEDLPVRVATYRFVPTVAGTYYIRFIQPDSTVMTDTITVH